MKPLEEIVKINKKAVAKFIKQLNKKEDHCNTVDLWSAGYEKGFHDGYIRAAEEFRTIITREGV
jgi:hypothetical protein